MKKIVTGKSLGFSFEEKKLVTKKSRIWSGKSGVLETSLGNSIVHILGIVNMLINAILSLNFQASKCGVKFGMGEGSNWS